MNKETMQAVIVASDGIEGIKGIEVEIKSSIAFTLRHPNDENSKIYSNLAQLWKDGLILYALAHGYEVIDIDGNTTYNGFYLLSDAVHTRLLQSISSIQITNS